MKIQARDVKTFRRSTNKAMAQYLGVTVPQIVNAAYRQGLKKDPKYLHNIRSKSAKKRWRKRTLCVKDSSGLTHKVAVMPRTLARRVRLKTMHRMICGARFIPKGIPRLAFVECEACKKSLAARR